MKLNETSYVHKKIRHLCQLLEVSTGLQLVTNLGQEFQEIRFMGRLSYLVIDHQKQAIFTLSCRLTKEELEATKDLILYLQWLETGRRIQEQIETSRRQKNRQEAK